MANEDPVNSAEARVLNAQMRSLDTQLQHHGATLRDISSSLQVLTRLEQGHGHVLEQLKAGSIRMTDHESRIRLIEDKMPQLMETRKWVIAGILTGVAMIGIALVKMVVVDPVKAAASPQVIYLQAPQQPVQQQQGQNQ